jgi:hypothetical protein
MESGQGGMLVKEVLKAPELIRFKALWRHAQEREMAAVAFDYRSDLAAEVHEVGKQDAHDVEAVGNDTGVGEPAFDHGAVRAGEIDADHPDALSALEGREEGEQIGFTAAFDDIEDLAVFEVAEGGGEALAFVEGVLVDAQDVWTLKTHALGGLARGELGVDASDGGSAQTGDASHGGGRDALVVMKVNLLAERLRAAPARKQSGKRRDEGPFTIPAGETPGMDDELGGLAKAVEMTSLAPVAALAAEAAASAARAAHPALGTGRDMNFDAILVLDSQHPIALNSDSVIHRGHGGGSPRPMSPFFDQEPVFGSLVG